MIFKHMVNHGLSLGIFSVLEMSLFSPSHLVFIHKKKNWEKSTSSNMAHMTIEVCWSVVAPWGLFTWHHIT